jgi:putative inorganic carbon (HCO3(-)) transporter
MRNLIVLSLIGIGTILSFASPAFAACFMIWVDIFRPFGWAKAVEPFPVAKLVVAVFCASFLISWMRGKIAPRPNRATIGIFLFLLWSFLDTFICPNPTLAMNGFSDELKILSPILFTSMIYRKFRNIEYMVWAMALSVGIYGAQAGLHALLVGHPVTDMAIAGGQMMDRNDFIEAVLLSLPLLLFMIQHYSGRFLLAARIFTGILFVLSLVAVPLSNSRGGILAFAGMVLFATALSKKKLRNFALLIVLVPLALFLVPDSTWERMNTIELSANQKEGSAGERMQQMAGGLRMTQDHLLTGVGPYAFVDYINLYTPARLEPHCIWIKCSAELGVIGLIIYLTTIVYVFAGLFAIYRRTFLSDKRISAMAIAFCISHLGFCLSSTFGNQLYSEYYWCLIALSGGFIQFVNTTKPKNAPAKA